MEKQKCYVPPRERMLEPVAEGKPGSCLRRGGFMMAIRFPVSLSSPYEGLTPPIPIPSHLSTCTTTVLHPSVDVFWFQLTDLIPLLISFVQTLQILRAELFLKRAVSVLCKQLRTLTKDDHRQMWMIPRGHQGQSQASQGRQI